MSELNDLLDPGETSVSDLESLVSSGMSRTESVTSVFSLPGAEESEADLEADYLPDEDFILPQKNRQNIIDFVNFSLFNKKKPLQIIRRQYPDLNNFIRASACLKQEKGST